MPAQTHYRSDNRELENFKDPLLQKQQGAAFYGRKKEVETLVGYLRSAETSGDTIHPVVVSEGGMGKTELCKAALRTYWETTPETTRVWFIDLESATTVDDFWQRLAGALGWDSGKVYHPEQVVEGLLRGIFYLDNLESVGNLETPEDLDALRKALRLISSKPGVRLLASSRVEVPGWGETVDLGALEPTEAADLFREIWNQTSAQSIPDNSPELLKFVSDELGGLPLALVLVAAQGKYEFKLTAVIQRWNEEGVALARRSGGIDSRLDRLETSIRLSLNRLSSDARLLWGLSAFFPTGLPEDFFQELVRQKSTFQDARTLLVEHRIWHRRANGRWHLSPPLARFARDQARIDADGFEAGEIFEYLGAWLKGLGEIASKNQTGKEVLRLREEFETMEATVVFFVRLTKPPAGLMEVIHEWYNHFSHSTFISRRILVAIKSYHVELGDLHRANTMFALGACEILLCANNSAKECFSDSLMCYKKIGSSLGQANALTHLGELERLMGNYEISRQYYKDALPLYEEVKDDLGRANAIKNLGTLECYVGNFKEAHQCFHEALLLYQKTGSILGQANTLREIGVLHFSMGQNDLSRIILHQALDFHEKCASDRGRANVLLSLGKLDWQENKVASAKSYWQTALTIFEKHGDIQGQVWCHANLFHAAHQLGDPTTAQQHLQAAQTCAERVGSPDLIAYVTKVAAEINGTTS